MLLVDKLRCLEHLDYLISHQVRGTPIQIAKRIGVSRSTLYEYLQILVYYGAKIAYDRHRQCFYYGKDGYCKLKFDDNKGGYREDKKL